MTNVCFIVPESGNSLTSHNAYLKKFIDEASKHIRTRTITEKNLLIRFLPIRFLLLIAVCVNARLHGCSIFYVHYSYVGVFAARFVTWILGGKVYYWSCGNMWLFGKQRVLRIILRIITVLVTGNDTMKQAYHEHMGVPLHKIAVMPNWINGEEFDDLYQKRTAMRSELGIAESDNVVLFLHRLAPRKGSQYLPDIIRAVNKRHPNTRVIIAGSGPDEQILKDVFHHNDHVRFLGAWPNNRVPELMAASDVYIMPSEEEGFPRVIIEAQAAQLPYAAFNAGGTSEISPDAARAYIVPIGATREFNAAIEKLLSMDINKRNELKHILKTHAKQYDRARVALRFTEIVTQSAK